MNKGYFFSFEGMDGVGKTTQATLLAEYLPKITPSQVIKVREPGGTPVCEEIRNILKSKEHLQPICELLLFNAARNQLLGEKIIPAVQAGNIVICDRFIDSTIAYQAFGNKLPLQTVIDVINCAVKNNTPDCTFMLTLDEETARSRAVRESGRDGIAKYDNATSEFRQKIREGFSYSASSWPNRVVVIDASGSESEVHQRIRAVAKARLRSASLTLDP